MKKFIRTLTVLLALLTVMSSLSLISSFAADFENFYVGEDAFFGDADSDGKLTVKDATSVQKHLAKMIRLDRQSQLLADVDGNLKLTISDATDIQKYLANIISFFEASPALICETDSDPVRFEVNMEENIYSIVKIPTAGYYRFRTRRISGGTCSFRILDGNETVGYGESDSSIADEYVYLTAGKYRVELQSSYMYEKDINEFSVTAADDKAPFEVSDAKVLKPGDKVEIKAGEGNKVFRVEHKNLPEFYDAHYIFTEGADSEVSLISYDKYMQGGDHSVETDDGLNRYISISGYYSSSDPWRYLVVEQKEGGSGFTLNCESYMDYHIENSEKLSAPFNTEITTTVTREGIYNGRKCVVITADESGYYKMSVEGGEGILAAYGGTCGDSQKGEFSSKSAFNVFVGTEDGKACSVEYLEAGKPYLSWIYVYSQDDNEAKVSVELSNEEEYNTFKAECDKQQSQWLEGEALSVFDGHDEIKLDEEVYVSLRSFEEMENYEEDSKIFKFTPDRDIEVVAFTNGAENAVMYVYDANGKFAGAFTQSGKLSPYDATVYGTLKAGETCYFKLISYSYYGDGFYFKVTSADDYTPLS